MDVAHKRRQVKAPATRNDKDGVGSRRRPQSKEVRSPSPSSSSSRRCQSPPSRTIRLTSESTPKRSKSAERKRPSSPNVDIQISSGKVWSGRSPEGLWPSTMRRLSVSLQKEKPVINKVEVGKKRRENAEMARSSLSCTSTSRSRRMSLDGMVKPIQKTATDAARLPSAVDRLKIGLGSIDDNHLRVPRPNKMSSTRGVSPSPATHSNTSTSRGISPSPTPARQSRGTSPSPTSARRLVSPSPSPPISPTPSRGTSPTPSTSASVLSFILHSRNGKKSAEDAHQLRILHNRYLQWKFSNAQADVVLHAKEVIAQKSLYNVWNDTLALCETVTLKRISLQQLRLQLKLNSLLNGQIVFLDDWALVERDQISSLSGAIDDLKADTLRLPVTRGARVDTESLRLAVCSAVDVMHTMESSICSLLPRVETMNSLIGQLAFVALQEIEMLDEWEALMASTAAVRVEEYSLRTQLIQMGQPPDNNDWNSNLFSDSSLGE